LIPDLLLESLAGDLTRASERQRQEGPDEFPAFIAPFAESIQNALRGSFLDVFNSAELNITSREPLVVRLEGGAPGTGSGGAGAFGGGEGGE
jgi:hypothetical protein